MTDVPDEGRQPERTALAHWRTELAVAAVAGLIVRNARPGIQRVVVAAVAVVAVAAATAAGWWRTRQLDRRAQPTATRVLAITAAAVLALQAVALVVVLHEA
jgi:hypothetical protein